MIQSLKQQKSYLCDNCINDEKEKNQNEKK